MISPQEATRIILSHPFQFVDEEISTHHSLGRILIEDIVADTDLPPFNRIMMDGVAIKIADWRNGIRHFNIAATQKAGSPQTTLSENAACIEVMTGGICPQSADSVIPYEEIEIIENSCAIHSKNVRAGQNIHVRGSDKIRGDILVQSGKKIGAAEIGITVSVGKTSVHVASLPRVHIFSTGDELVETDIIPEAHQIRRSNVYALQQILKAHGIESSQSHLPDDYEIMKTAIAAQLQKCDALLLTGAVSKGKFDFIPTVLEELGVTKLFHGIAQRPGKPMWFGNKNEKVVFAFPGNPVSTFMCANRYLIPWLKKSLNKKEPVPFYAKLATSFENNTTLTFFLQVKITFSMQGEILAVPAVGGGSGDYSNLTDADGFLELPVGPNVIEAHSIHPLYLYRHFV